MNFWKKWFRNSKRIYMIPNRFGLALSFIFIFFTVTGAHYSNNLIFLFAFIIVSFLLIAILQTAKNVRGLMIVKSHIQAGFPGEISKADLLVENQKSISQFGLYVQIHKQKNSAIVHEIQAKDKLWISQPFLLPAKRGLFEFDKIKVSTQVPYGLFYGWRYVYKKNVVVVYPKPHGISKNYATATNKGSDFSGLKQFVTGDTIARISWKHSAKRDELLLKQFKEDEPEVKIFDINDCPQSELEAQLSQLALWVVDAEKGQKSYGLKLDDLSIKAGRGTTHMHECLYQLGIYKT